MGKAARKKRESRMKRARTRKPPKKMNGRWEERSPAYSLAIPGQGPVDDSPLFGGEIAYYDDNAHRALIARGWTDFRRDRQGDMWEWPASGPLDISEFENGSGPTTICVTKNGFDVYEPWMDPGLPAHHAYDTLGHLLDDIQEIESWRADDPGNSDPEG